MYNRSWSNSLKSLNSSQAPATNFYRMSMCVLVALQCRVICNSGCVAHHLDYKQWESCGRIIVWQRFFKGHCQLICHVWMQCERLELGQIIPNHIWTYAWIQKEIVERCIKNPPNISGLPADSGYITCVAGMGAIVQTFEILRLSQTVIIRS